MLDMVLRRATVFSLIAMAVLVGCGGADDERPASTVTVTEATAEGDGVTEEREPAAEEPPPPKPLTPAEQAEATVKGYYAAVDSGSYRKAWTLLSPSLQSELGGYRSWKDGYATTVGTKASSVNATDISKASATVSLTLEARDLDACGDNVDQTFAGTWTLARVGGSLLGSAFNVEKTGGGTPVTDATSCGGGGTPAPASPAGCDPNYTGCVPPYPPDVDCIDVRQEVDIIGEDVHQLDIGGDEQACEIFTR